MRKVFLWFLISYSFMGLAQAQQLVLNNSPISDLAGWVSDKTGRTITFADSSDVPISINIPDSESVDPWALFESSVTTAGLFINQVDSIYVVTSKNVAAPQELEPFHYPIETYSYPVYPVNLNDIHDALKSLLQVWHSQEVLSTAKAIPSFSVHKSANQSALLLSIPPRFKADVEIFINSLNKPPKQVLIEAIIFETTNLDFEAVGIDFRSINDSGLSFDFGANTGPLSVVTKGFGISYSVDGDVKSVLRALDTNDKTTILSTPELRIMDREFGKVQIGQEVPFITSTNTTDSGQTTNTVVRETVGLNFSVHPVIQSDSSIRIKFYTSVGSLTGDSTAADVITSNRSVETVITAFDGELVYLGGLITEEIKDSIVSVPGLSDLPILGGLFASKEQKENRTKLSVFIKTTII